MKIRALLLLLAALAFAAGPLFVPGFGGYEPDQFPIPVEDPPVQPAGYAFAIWGPIYAWLIVMAGFGVWKRAEEAGWDAPRLPLIASLVIGAFWLAVAEASPIWATILIWAMLVPALVALLRTPDRDPWLLQAPIGLYAGWLTAASSVSLGLLATGYGVGLFGPVGWAVAAQCLTLAIAVAVLRARPSATFGFAICWALVALLVQNGAGLAGLFALGAAAVVAALTVRSLRRAP